MGQKLHRWAQSLDHPCLTRRRREVLGAICLVADDESCLFEMSGRRLIAEHIPDLSYGNYRNIVSNLTRNDILEKVAQGGGRTSNGRGRASRYRVKVATAKPYLLESKPVHRQEPEPKVETGVSQVLLKTLWVHQKVDALLSAGITPETLVDALDALQVPPGTPEGESPLARGVRQHALSE